jgi:hypothetical protein
MIGRRRFLGMLWASTLGLAVGGKAVAVATQKATASLGGKPLILSGPVRWALTEGVHPSTGRFEMAPDDAKALLEAGGPVTLEINPQEGNPVRVEQLWVLHVEPGPHPWISRVLVADRRWMWPYAHVLIRMNIRRNVGTKRILANDQFAVDFDRAPEVAFARYSLDQTTRRFVALRMVQKVFEQIAEKEKEFGGSAFPLVLDQRVGSKIRSLPIEGLEIDEPGDQAAGRALSALPEAGITVDYDGKVVVYSRAGGDEEAIVKGILPEIRGMGHVDLVVNRKIRPKTVRVWYTREAEVRWDFVESASARSSTVVAGSEPLGTLRRMENVLPIPDYQLTVSEISAQPIPQGTWLTYDQCFRAWGNLPLLGVTRALDHDLMQRAMIPEMDLYAALQLSGDRPDAKGNLKPWVGRIAAAMNHYRTTFRINTQWMDRILSLRAYRVATIDPQSGQRGPARAYGDYAILYTQRALWRSRAQGKPLDYAINRSAFPSGGNLDSDAEPSPAVVSIIDHDQGIIRVDYRGTDPLSGDMRTILPSQIAVDSMPTWDASDKTRPISWDTVVGTSKPPRASASYRLAVVMTAVPAAPNDKRQLHMIEVKPSEIKDLLPTSLHGGLETAEGPSMDIRIGPNVEVARIQWSDARSADIEKVFGIGDGEPNLKGLVLNEGDGTNLERGASLNQIARATAARVYGSLVDRYEGEATGAMNGGLHLNGWVSEISHEYTPRGETLTRVAMPPKIPQMNLAAFLDSNTRAALFRLVKAEP